MLKSPTFDVQFKGIHSLILPDKEIRPFLESGHKRVKVMASFEGKSVEFYGALQKRKTEYRLMFGKEHQKFLGVFPYDFISLKLSEDRSKYGVEMPEELDAVLESDIDAHEIFEGFTDGKKRSIIYMIARYKTSQTRIDKSIILCENLNRGIRNPKELLKS
ncbi:YdeI/OmpD-associated family protein [uncultured Muriicola sp.]|uniref:YdeI/OmpD-associated family protein n=1 Tax=uncultured Muriicola sp. TaxID=1583102 RepID=UPI00260F1578|nr:YdeI/OmpD-associated family protein [uncultured Muriicola sp.]